MRWVTLAEVSVGIVILNPLLPLVGLPRAAAVGVVRGALLVFLACLARTAWRAPWVALAAGVVACGTCSAGLAVHGDMGAGAATGTRFLLFAVLVGAPGIALLRWTLSARRRRRARAVGVR